MASIQQDRLFNKIGHCIDVIYTKVEQGKMLIVGQVPSLKGIYLFFIVGQHRLVDPVTSINIDTDPRFSDESVNSVNAQLVGPEGGQYRLRNCFATCEATSGEFLIELDKDYHILVRKES